MLFIISLAWVNLRTLALKQVLFCLSEDSVANQCNLSSIQLCNNTVYQNIWKLVLLNFNRQQTIILSYFYTKQLFILPGKYVYKGYEIIDKNINYYVNENKNHRGNRIFLLVKFALVIFINYSYDLEIPFLMRQHWFIDVLLLHLSQNSFLPFRW